MKTKRWKLYKKTTLCLTKITHFLLLQTPDFSVLFDNKSTELKPNLFKVVPCIEKIAKTEIKSFPLVSLLPSAMLFLLWMIHLIPADKNWDQVLFKGLPIPCSSPVLFDHESTEQKQNLHKALPWFMAWIVKRAKHNSKLVI